MGGLPSSTGQLPSAADGSRIDAIPNGSHQLPIPTDELVVGEVLPPRMPCGPAVACQGPRHLCVQRSGCGPPVWALSTCVPWFAGHLPPGIGVRTPQGPRHLCLPPSRPLRGCVSGPLAPAPRWPRGWAPGCWGGRIRALGTCALSPCLALRHGGEACQGPRHLRYPPLTQFPGGRPPPCPTECPRSRRCPTRGRWRPRSPVLRRAPRPSTCSGR